MHFFKISIFMVIFASFSFGLASNEYPAPNQGCLSCHKGIEPIKDSNSDMAQQIYALGEGLGDPNGCVVCHGGNPNETKDKKIAHKGAPEGNALDFFTPVPGSFEVIDKTCGTCHPQEASSTPKSLMNTEAGKIKVITSGWGVDNNTFKVKYADRNVSDEDGLEPIYGTPEYKAYMKALIEQHKEKYPEFLKELPRTDLKRLEKNPEEAVFSFMRNCNACHTSNKGKQLRGHYRGMGCSSCHIPYGVEGYYEGDDKSIDKTKPGHLLVHSIQATRKSKVKVNGHEYSGIQVSTCNACHSSGRRVSTQFQGLFPADRHGKYATFDENGDRQKANATYVYKHIEADVHFKKGMLCQDCHTSPDMHGNGNIGTVPLGDVEIECQDCHGTPTKYPWELRLGFGDELLSVKDILDKDLKAKLSKPRGLSEDPMEVTESFATSYDAKDGFLLSARGNPLGNVVKDGDKVILHSAAGKDHVVPILKDIEKNNLWKNPDGRLAMVGVSKHIDKMECYTCHSRWASSYYGYNYTVDFRKGNEMIDWVGSSQVKNPDGTYTDFNKSYLMMPGSSDGDYSHARWEDPLLGINGEGRVTPLVGVIQTVGTVIDENGKILIRNNIAKNKKGMLSIDMQPMQPHTNTLQARSCESCHENRTVMGFGEVYNFENEKPVYMGVKDANGKIITKHHTEQIGGIKALENNRDFMKVLDENGKQLMKVDTHFKRSSPLTKEQIKTLKKRDYKKEAEENLKAIDKNKKSSK